MTIEYSPVDNACNIKCDYCYENPMRDAGNIAGPADWERAKAMLIKLNYRFSLHGGEPLLAPIDHLEEVFAFGLERYGRNGIQTNGNLITDEHTRLFKQYRVGVGVSVDGPVPLNRLRRGCGDEATDRASQATLDALVKLVKAKVVPSLIVTVHQLNGLIAVRQQMFDWFAWLEELGIRDINLHMLEVESGMESLALSEPENIAFFYDTYNWAKGRKLRFQPFWDIERLLLGEELKKVSCIWNACDPLTTSAVDGVSRGGVRSNCGRTNKDGVNWVKADKPGRERYFVLRHTPQEHGGCKDCRFFVFCKGNCPGTAIDGDWRNRTVHCSTWYHLFSAIEQKVISEARLPRSQDPSALERLETDLLGGIGLGGEHVDAPHIDTPHEDTPHIDWHEDSDKTEQKGIPATWLDV